MAARGRRDVALTTARIRFRDEGLEPQSRRVRLAGFDLGQLLRDEAAWGRLRGFARAIAPLGSDDPSVRRSSPTGPARFVPMRYSVLESVAPTDGLIGLGIDNALLASAKHKTTIRLPADCILIPDLAAASRACSAGNLARSRNRIGSSAATQQAILFSTCKAHLPASVARHLRSTNTRRKAVLAESPLAFGPALTRWDQGLGRFSWLFSQPSAAGTFFGRRAELIPKDEIDMATANRTRDCPYCREEIREDALKCKHCGSSVTPERPSHEGACPYCKEQIHPEAVKCKHCKSDLRSKAPSDCECN